MGQLSQLPVQTPSPVSEPTNKLSKQITVILINKEHGVHAKSMLFHTKSFVDAKNIGN